MKPLSKTALILIVIALLLSLFPAMQSPASAAVTPVISLTSTTAQNPFLELFMDYETYHTGGPFTVSFDWKTQGMISNDANEPDNYYAFAAVVGYVYGSTTESQAATDLKITKNISWTSASFSFENVGTYEHNGGNFPGNMLRFGFYKTKGTLSIRNLVIKNNADAVVYSMNADETILEILAELHSYGLTECDLSEIQSRGEDHWNAGLLGTGKYGAYLAYLDETTGATVNTTISQPTTNYIKVVSGEQTIVPKERMVGMVKYQNGKPIVYGDAAGFGNAPWDPAELSRINLVGSIEITVNNLITKEQITSVNVMGGSLSGKQKFNISDLGNLQPGSYTVEFWAQEWTQPYQGTQTCYSNQYAFTLIVPKASVCQSGHTFIMPEGICYFCGWGDPNVQFGTTNTAVTTTAGTTTVPTTTNKTVFATMSPPNVVDVFAISGSDRFVPAKRLRTMTGYTNGEFSACGLGEGFKYPDWNNSRYKLPEITWQGSLQIYENSTKQFSKVTVYFENGEDAVYHISDLSTLEPGRYIIHCSAMDWEPVDSRGQQLGYLYEFGFRLIVPDKKASTTAPPTVSTTPAPTTAEPTTKPQPCPTGHEFFNGFCTICLQSDPAYRATTLRPGVDCPGRPTLPHATNQSTTANVTPMHPNSAVDIEVDEPDDDSIYFAAFGVLIAALSVASIILIVLILRKK